MLLEKKKDLGLGKFYADTAPLKTAKFLMELTPQQQKWEQESEKYQTRFSSKFLSITGLFPYLREEIIYYDMSLII